MLGALDISGMQDTGWKKTGRAAIRCSQLPRSW
jgi:hypothetical protein